MWSPVTPQDGSEPAPASRCKHSATLLAGHVYLLGGKCGNVPLKDFWRYSLADGRWTQLQASGERPPCLQEHTAVAYQEQLYVFGGEVGFSSGSETPLWVYSVARGVWRKARARRGVALPRARRGHTALVHRGAMLVYGGYQDLRGSCADLWAFHFDTESWHLLAGGGGGPPARHRHSAVLHGDAMWVYGGMTDLVARGDTWRWCTRARSWSCVRARGPQPPPLHGHAAAAAAQHMLLLGAEREPGVLWRLHFASEAWQRVRVPGAQPPPRSEAVALTVAAPGSRAPRPTTDAAAAATTYVLGAPGFISRLAQLRPGAACHYTVLHADSTESLLTPRRLPASRSAGPLVERDDFDQPDDSDSGVQLVHVRPAPASHSYSSHLAYADTATSTSDYASLDSSSACSRAGGFCNPNYLDAGPQKTMAALLGSAVPKREPPADLELELQSLGGRRRVARAGRADSRVAPAPSPPALYVYLVGGKETHVTVIKRPLTIWKLQLY